VLGTVCFPRSGIENPTAGECVCLRNKGFGAQFRVLIASVETERGAHHTRGYCMPKESSPLLGAYTHTHNRVPSPRITREEKATACCVYACVHAITTEFECTFERTQTDPAASKRLSFTPPLVTRSPRATGHECAGSRVLRHPLPARAESGS